MASKCAALIRVITILPSTTNLFKFLKQRYSHSQVSEINSVFKWRSRRICVQERILHLKQCLDSSVIPKHIYVRVKKLRPRFVGSVGRAFVMNEVSTEEENLERANDFYRGVYRRVSRFLSFFDWIRFCKLLGESGCRLCSRLRKENEEKLRWLRKQRFGSVDVNSLAVVNLSSVQLTETQMEVLSCGPRFGIPAASVCKEEILGEFEMFYRQIEDALSVSALGRAECSERKSELKRKLSGIANEYGQQKRQAFTFPFGKEHLNAIRELRSNVDLVITRPDKGSGIVLLDRVDYVDRMMDILKDETKFECMGRCEDADRTELNEKALQAFLYRKMKDKKISEEVYQRVRPSGSTRPRMYGLPKTHKPEPIPLRPVLSMIGSAHHELARWLAELLKPVVERYSSHTVKDSFSFCDVLRQQRNLGDTAFMCSFDVRSLFTNVPLAETIQICLDTLYRSEDEPPPCMEESLLKSLLLKCTRDVEFSFDGMMYRQTDGVAMGSPLGPVLANIFLGYCELKIPDHKWPDVYRRFVDDTFSVFLAGEAAAVTFLEVLNNIHPALAFTMESEADRKLPFLDVLVFREIDHFTTSVYRKPTFTGVYTRWDSFCATSQKIALIRSLTVRAKRICSPEHLDKEILKLKSIFSSNGYPPPITERVIDQTLCAKPPQQSASLRQVVIRLPWLGPVSRAASSRIELVTRKAAPWCKVNISFTTRHAFNTCRKDVLPADFLNNVVYLFSCSCKRNYVGRTTLRLQERMRQHIPDDLVRAVVPGGLPKRDRGRPRKDGSSCYLPEKPVQMDSVSSRTRSACRRACDSSTKAPPTPVATGAKTDTAITTHLRQSEQCRETVCPDIGQYFKVLSRGRNVSHLQVLEAVYIARMKPELCTQKERIMTLSLVL